MWTHRLSLATALAAWIYILGSGLGLAHGEAQHWSAMSVGLLTTTLCLVAILEGRRVHPAVPRLAALALLLVVGRRLLGALATLELSPALLGWAQQCLSVVFLAPVLAVACLTRHAARPDSPARRDAVPGLNYLMLLLATGLCFAQVALGALVRHLDAGLACSDLPLCDGSVLPLGESGATVLHAAHRLCGLLFAGAMFVALPQLRPHLRRQTDLTRRLLLLLLPLGVLAQLALGMLSVWSYLGLFFVTLHRGLGALLLCGLLVLCFRLRAASLVPATADVTGAVSPQGDAA